jgi:hypothetical protein
MSMTGLRVFLIACLVCLGGNAWAADSPTIPAGARVGIIDMVTSDVVHFHIGRAELNNFMRTYRGNWAPADIIDDPLIAGLTAAGFQPVAVPVSEKLRGERQSWIVEKPRSERLPRGCMKELGRIMREQNLGGLVVVAAGANSDPEYVEDDRYSRLPGTVQGLGFSTSDLPIGSTKVGVFDFTQFIVIAKVDDDPELVLRDWGGNRVYDWPDFDPGDNIKALSDELIAQLRPVFADAIKKRIDTRLMPRLKP